MKILVFVPCYNCEKQIVRTLEGIDKILTACPVIQGVYLIDNRSVDATLAEAFQTISGLSNKEKFQVYRNYENAGLGGSHKIAFTLARESGATHLLVFHGDHQASSDDIAALIEESSTHEEVTVLGSRFADLSKLSGYSLTRKFGNLSLNIIYSGVTRKDITDLGSGLNLFRISDFNSDDLQNFDNGFTFNMDLLLYLVRTHKIFRYIPIRWSTTDQVSNAHSLKVGFKTLFKLGSWILYRSPENKAHTASERVTSAK